MFCFFFILIVSFKLLQCATDNNGYLSHVIMPFPIKQVENVKANFNLWAKYPPCLQEFKNSNVSFIFFVSSANDDKLRNELVKSFNSYSHSNCFRSVKVEFFNLGKDDNYFEGSRLMFEHMISKKLNYGNDKVSHVFYMEPDCIPIRSNWLRAINQQIVPPNAFFWIKGSIFRGKKDVLKSAKIYNRIHINGNAIYNVGSDLFKKLYFEKIRPFISKNHEEGAYDTDIYKFLLWQQAKYTASYFHLFQFSDFIQNHWHSEFSMKEILEESPHTFLIHGGYARD